MTTELGVEPALRTYLAVLRQQRWWVAGAALIGLGAGIAFSVTQPREYTASAQILVKATGDPVAGAVAQPVTPTDVQTELQLVTSAPVRRAVQRRLGVIPAVSASEVGQTNVIEVAATSTDPAWAARTANAFAQSFIAYEQKVRLGALTAAENQLRSQISGISHQVHRYHKRTSPQVAALLNQEAVLKEQLAQMEVSAAGSTGDVELVMPAQHPTAPSSPGSRQDGAAGLGAGLLAGLALAFARNSLNDTLDSKEAAEQHGGAPVIGLIPVVPSWKKRDRAMVVSLCDPSSPSAEAFRSLRTSLQFVRQERELRTILVTSPAASEGKTSTITNLGVAFAQAGERVVVVSCDLRRPRLGRFLELAEVPGLTSVLLGEHPVEQVLQQVPGQPNLWVLGAGVLAQNPAELLSGPAVQKVFAHLRDHFDLVLVDSPPLLPVTDAAVLSKVADGTLVVVAVGRTRQGDLRRTAEKLRHASAPVIGLVLNQTSKQGGYGYGYGYPRYHATPGRQLGPAGSNGKVRSGSSASQE
jgi:polysaccharide biosynthesis transport protein